MSMQWSARFRMRLASRSWDRSQAGAKNDQIHREIVERWHFWTLLEHVKHCTGGAERLLLLLTAGVSAEGKFWINQAHRSRQSRGRRNRLLYCLLLLVLVALLVLVSLLALLTLLVMVVLLVLLVLLILVVLVHTRLTALDWYGKVCLSRNCSSCCLWGPSLDFNTSLLWKVKSISKQRLPPKSQALFMLANAIIQFYKESENYLHTYTVFQTS